jgi:CDP-diacylglycerol--glycerol-3-phosphate 3-phosphatidyltransferase
MIPVLWVLAILHHHHWFVGALAFTWATDAVDGHIARICHAESAFGAKLDSIADNSVQLSVLGWLFLLRPEFYTRYWPLIAILVVLFVASMVLQVRRKAPLHTYANKATAWILALFLLYTFAIGVQGVAMWITFATLVYALGEGIVLLLFGKQVDEDTRFIWQRRNWVAKEQSP